MTNMFLALADIHGKTEMLERILKENPQVGGVFVAGDVTNFGKEKDAEKVLSVFAECLPDAALFFIGGNCDTVAARHSFEKHPGYLEQKCATLAIGGHPAGDAATTIRIVGCGGGLLHMGLTPFELTDEELELGLKKAYARCPEKEDERPVASPPHALIVLTHTPPKDTLADLRSTRHLGSHAFACLLYEYEPLIWICGHIHEGRSVQWEGRTLVINPGPAALGSYAILHVGQNLRGLSGMSAAAELRAL